MRRPGEQEERFSRKAPDEQIGTQRLAQSRKGNCYFFSLVNTRMMPSGRPSGLPYGFCGFLLIPGWAGWFRNTTFGSRANSDRGFVRGG